MLPFFFDFYLFYFINFPESAMDLVDILTSSFWLSFAKSSQKFWLGTNAVDRVIINILKGMTVFLITKK